MPYIGQIRMFAGNFAPQGWAFCEGQLLPIAEYDTLFTLIGTTYGGNGAQTFALPDLRGRVPIHQGNYSGGYNYSMGGAGGVEEVTLMVSQIPAHSHKLSGPGLLAMGSVAGNQTSPAAHYPAMIPGVNLYSTQIRERVFMQDPNMPNPNALVESTGGSQPHTNRQPFLAINFIISLFGIFPTQS